jgi:hypothetical protein
MQSHLSALFDKLNQTNLSFGLTPLAQTYIGLASLNFPWDLHLGSKIYSWAVAVLQVAFQFLNINSTSQCFRRRLSQMLEGSSHLGTISGYRSASVCLLNPSAVTAPSVAGLVMLACISWF